MTIIVDGNSNESAMGYAIIAMKGLEYDVEAIQKVIGKMYRAMDDHTVKEAENVKENF